MRIFTLIVLVSAAEFGVFHTLQTMPKAPNPVLVDVVFVTSLSLYHLTRLGTSAATTVGRRSARRGRTKRLIAKILTAWKEWILDSDTWRR